MKIKKRTFFRNVLEFAIRNERWYRDPKNYDKVMAYFQMRKSFWVTWSLALLLIVSSCVPVKKVEKSNLKADVKTETQVTKNTETKESGSAVAKTETTSDLQQKKNTSVEENETEETTIHTILYDTKSKVDSLTNRPVVASETTQKTTKGKTKKAVESTETLYSSNEVTALFSEYMKSYTSKIDSLTTENSSLKSEVSTKTEQANNWWKWFLAGVITAVFAGFAWKFKWYKVFLPKI